MIRIIIEIDEKGINISGIPGKQVSFDFLDSNEYKEKKEEARKLDSEKHLKKLQDKPIAPESRHIHGRKSVVTKKPRICPKCGKEFIPSGNRQKYCCIECGMKPKHYTKKRDVSNIKKCPECGNYFDPDRTVSGLHEFCSEHCRQESLKRESFKNKPNRLLFMH